MQSAATRRVARARRSYEQKTSLRQRVSLGWLFSPSVSCLVEVPAPAGPTLRPVLRLSETQPCGADRVLC